MPLTGTGDFGASLAEAGETGASATPALFGHGYGLRPSYGGNSFTLGLPGGGSGSRPSYGGNSFTLGLAGGGSGPRPGHGGNSFLLGLPGGAYRYTDPGVRYERAIGQGTNALLGVLGPPAAMRPTAPTIGRCAPRRALSRQQRRTSTRRCP